MKLNLKTSIVLALVFVLVVSGVAYATNDPAGINTTVVKALRALNAVQFNQTLTVLGDTTLTNVTVTNDLTVDGAAIANGVVDDSGHLTETYITATNSIDTNILGVTGPSTLGGLALANGGLLVSVPTAVASATPAALVNNLGNTNDGLVVSLRATPVFKVGNSGTITGKVLQYASSGQAIVCNTTTITGTGVLNTGLSTPVAVVALNMGADTNYDHNRLSFTNTAATVTAKVWNGAATPAAAATGVPVDWCVIGTP